PSTAPISTVDNVIYTLTDNIIGNVPKDLSAIIIQRSNIIIDGGGHTVEGARASYSQGFYLRDLTNVTIQNVNIKHFWFGIWLRRSSNNSIHRNNLITNSWNGILLSHSSNNNSIYGNNMTENSWAGIQLERSSNNSIFENNIVNNGHCGIYILYSSYNNIFGNNVTESWPTLDYGGISLDESSHNTISRNNVTDNNIGIWLRRSSDNIIYHNRFVNNTRQVWILNATNTWDDGYPSGGNYWSDYETRYPDAAEIDNSGIWDTPYFIDENNQDDYPTIKPTGTLDQYWRMTFIVIIAFSVILSMIVLILFKKRKKW
ncbi:MAG: nitrous oxide reductase family maturation protein NosD, partial [Candidatus Bathyarchaeia archaeon]